MKSRVENAQAFVSVCFWIESTRLQIPGHRFGSGTRLHSISMTSKIFPQWTGVHFAIKITWHSIQPSHEGQNLVCLVPLAVLAQRQASHLDKTHRNSNLSIIHLHSSSTMMGWARLRMALQSLADFFRDVSPMRELDVQKTKNGKVL